MIDPSQVSRRASPRRIFAPARARSSLAFLGALALVAGLVVALSSAAEAAITTPFTSRFSANTSGDILIRGNGLLTCPAAATGCAAAQGGGTGNNNDFSMVFVDVDSDPSTRSSSSAVVQLPGDATVLFAGLYWSAYSAGNPTAPPAGTARNRLLLQAPGDAAYRTITAAPSDVFVSPAAGSAYQSFADVTDIVAGAGGGTYTAGDIFAGQGTDRYGAWSLVVAISSPSMPVRNLNVFDGFGTVQQNPTSDRSVDIPVSGFFTPPAGAVRTRLGTVVYEGDRGLRGDTFTVVRQGGATVPVTEAQNPADNVFNSTVTDNGVTVAGRAPAHDNLLGYDADVFDASWLGNAATSATLRLATGGETFFPGVVTFATDLYTPKLIGTKSASVTDVDGDGTNGAGDLITYTVEVTNIGEDAAVRAQMTDPVPLGTSYMPGSLTVNGTSVTDAVDSDPGDVAARMVRATLGTPSGGLGGVLPVGATTSVEFQVEITTDNLDGASILNVAGFSYQGDQTGTAISGTSNITQTPYNAPRSDLAVTKQASPLLLQRDGDLSVTYRMIVVNNGPKPEPAATLTDPLPVGFTATSIVGPGCAPTGPPVSCDLGGLAVGASAVVTVTGTMSATAPDPTSNTVTVSGSTSSVDPDPSNNTATAQVALNTPPVAVDDTATVPPSGTVDIDVVGNDTDVDGDPLTVTTAIVEPPAHGSVVVNGDGSLTYTSTDPTFKGIDLVTYQVCDDRGGCDIAVVTVNVPNKPPVATNDSTGTTPGNPVTIDVRLNDTDPNGDPLGPPSITSPPSIGTAVVNADGTITYTAPPGTPSGTVVNFDYQVCDNDTPPACATATVTVVIDNAAPVAVDDYNTTPFETPRTFTAAEIIGNDSDPNGDDLTITSVQDAAGGTAVLNGDGTVTFSPDDGFVGRASFTYTIDDGNGETSTATVYVDVPNSPPTAVDDTAQAPPGGSVDISILTNDTDPETPGQLTATLTGLPSSGSVLLNPDGTVTYTAEPGFIGTVTIPYTVCDPQGLCDDAEITITVPNAPPVAVDEERTVAANQSVTVPVDANDSDPNGGPVTVSQIVTQPTNGTATLNPDGTVTYTPNPNFTGTDTMVYEVCDEDTPPECAEATLTVDVLNLPPQAEADSARREHVAGQPTVVDLTDLLVNDSDPDGQPLTIIDFTQPGTGTVTQNPDGTLTYTAPPGFIGVVTFTYEVADGSGGVSRTTVTIEVVNEGPRARDNSDRTPQGQPVTIDVIGNDSDPEGDDLTVTAIPRQPAHGTVRIRPDGSIVYTPADGFTGTDSFTYTVCDPYGLCEDAVVTVRVAPGPTQPPPSNPPPDSQPGDEPPSAGILPDTGSGALGLLPWALALILSGLGLMALDRYRQRRSRQT